MKERIYLGEDAGWNENKKVTVKKHDEGVMFSNGIYLADEHHQDWCENVYADWSSLEDTGFYSQEFNQVYIEFVEDVGFRINGYTVHCYNSQNGYYSSDLRLHVKKDGLTIVEIDITDCVEDDIC